MHRDQLALQMRRQLGDLDRRLAAGPGELVAIILTFGRSEEHTHDLQSLMRSSYAVFCLLKKNRSTNHDYYPPIYLTDRHSRPDATVNHNIDNKGETVH